MQQLGLNKSDFEGARFSRVDHLKHLARLGRVDEELRLVEPAKPVVAPEMGNVATIVT
jgi:hypothetical protein